MEIFEQTSIAATVDSKNCSDESDTKSFEKKRVFKKIFLKKNKMETPDNGKSFPPIKLFSSSSSCSSLIENLNVSTKTSELLKTFKASSQTFAEIKKLPSDQPKASCEMSAEAKTCKKAEKPAKITVSGTFINVSF